MTTPTLAEADTPDLRTDRPSRRIRLFFWVILGAFSVFFAEVTVGSSMFPFFEPFSVLVTCPLYALHILVLGSIVLRHPSPLFASLFFAGAIFGLYEAYITKVLWSPPWNQKPVMVGGMAIIESMMLVLFYHAVMAFIVPLVAAERLLTSSGQATGTLKPRLAGWIDERWFAVAFAATCGISRPPTRPPSSTPSAPPSPPPASCWSWSCCGNGPPGGGSTLFRNCFPEGGNLGYWPFSWPRSTSVWGFCCDLKSCQGSAPRQGSWAATPFSFFCSCSP